MDKLPQRLVKPEHVERTTALLRRRGGSAVFIARFTAALRVLVPGMAGLSRLPYRQFLLFNALGGIAWAAETAVVGYLAGKSYHAAAHRLSLIGLGLLALIIGGYLIRRLRRTPRVRGLLAGRWSPTRWTGRPLTLVTIATLSSAWIFGGVTQDVLAHEGLATYDARWHADLIAHRTWLLTDISRIVTNLGSTLLVDVVVLIAVGLAVWRKRHIDAAIAVLTFEIGLYSRAGIALLVHRTRPPRTDWLAGAEGYAYPSGHTTIAGLGWGLALALTWPQLHSRLQKITACTIAALITAAVGLTRAYLGMHWPTDILGGWALGGLLLTLAVAALSYTRRVRTHR